MAVIINHFYPFEHQGTWMSKITNDGLTHMAKVGIKGLQTKQLCKLANTRQGNYILPYHTLQCRQSRHFTI